MKPFDGGEEVAIHPRPQMRRAWWQSLDGPWDFAMEEHAIWKTPEDVEWGGTIQVPFAPETAASGIGDTGFHETCWYRRVIQPPPMAKGDRLLIHFNAVDHLAMVWADDCPCAQHEGGYVPFTADLTPCCSTDRPITIVVRAFDDPFDLAKPRGKQDWQREPHSIWYPRTSGIWQTVWLERLPETSIESIRWTSSLERWEISLETTIDGPLATGMQLQVLLRDRGEVLAADRYAVLHSEVNRRIALSDPGIDDYRNKLLWSPHSPTLIEARIELKDAEGRVLDDVRSYTGLRSISTQGETVLLNGRPYPLRMVLCQGYWPESGMTAPDEGALRRDIELVKAMGFNGVRKHQKVEDPRWLYWADKLGILVWEEMPSAYRFTTPSVERLTREWLEVMRRDFSHPCIIVWVPFNESWGVPNLPEIASQRHYVEALYHLTRTLDPTRLVVGNDGWESTATDIIGIHDYDRDPQALAMRYGVDEDMPRLFRRERPGGRMIALAGTHGGQPIMLSEIGGIAYQPHNGSRFWGYSTARSAEEFEQKYRKLLEVVRQLPALAGFCYTQFADTYQEANGLLFADRRPKFPIERIAEYTRGLRLERQSQMEQEKRADRGAPGAQHDPTAP